MTSKVTPSSLLPLQSTTTTSSSYLEQPAITKPFKYTNNTGGIIYNIPQPISIKTIDAHDNYVFCVIQLSNGDVASCSLDKTIKIWDGVTYELKKIVTDVDPHSDYVNCIIQLTNGMLISGSHDKRIKVWNLETNKCIKTIDSHNGWILSLNRMKHEASILSTSGDKTIKIFNVITEECVMTFTGHTDYVRSAIELLDGRIVSGSDDKTIRIWDTKSGKIEVKIISNHTGWIRCLIQLKGGVDNGKIASASDDLTIRIFSLNGDFERLINGHSSTVTAIIQLADGRLASSSWDKTVRIWNLSNYQTEVILSGHSKGVYCLTQLSDNRLVTGSSDQSIKIYT